MVGPPENLTGSTESASFKIQPCKTCVSVPSTATFTPTSTGDTLVTVLKTGSATESVSTVETTASASGSMSGGSISASMSGSSTLGIASMSGSATSSRSTQISAAGKLVTNGMGRCIPIALILGMWIYPMLI